MSFTYKPPKKKPNKFFNAIKVVSDFANPMGGIGKHIVAPKIKKAYRQYKASKVGQSKGPTGGPTSIAKPKPKFKRPPIQNIPEGWGFPIGDPNKETNLKRLKKNKG
tara:strand:- start:46 stop:366 length:321 start_codon:yes stop_codon:yes gene_type:complete